MRLIGHLLTYVAYNLITIYIIVILVGFVDGLAYRSFINSLNDVAFSKSTVRLGIDYGPNLIGIATSNMLGMVSPVSTISNQANQTSISLRILQLAKREEAREIIVGLPVDKSGSMTYSPTNFNGQLCVKFSSVLATVANRYHPHISVILFDESYTTKEAQRRLSFGRTKGTLDAMSAACLLERYLDDEGGGSLPAKPYSWPLSTQLEIFNYNDVREHIRSLYYSDNQKEVESFDPKTASSSSIFKRRRFFQTKKFSDGKSSN